MRNQLSQIIKESTDVKAQTPISVHKFRVALADVTTIANIPSRKFSSMSALLDAFMSPYKKDRSD